MTAHRHYLYWKENWVHLESLSLCRSFFCHVTAVLDTETSEQFPIFLTITVMWCSSGLKFKLFYFLQYIHLWIFVIMFNIECGNKELAFKCIRIMRNNHFDKAKISKNNNIKVNHIKCLCLLYDIESGSGHVRKERKTKTQRFER